MSSQIHRVRDLKDSYRSHNDKVCEEIIKKFRNDCDVFLKILKEFQVMDKDKLLFSKIDMKHEINEINETIEGFNNIERSLVLDSPFGILESPYLNKDYNYNEKYTECTDYFSIIRIIKLLRYMRIIILSIYKFKPRTDVYKALDLTNLTTEYDLVSLQGFKSFVINNKVNETKDISKELIHIFDNYQITEQPYGTNILEKINDYIYIY
jgi:hypothetical protein